MYIVQLMNDLIQILWDQSDDTTSSRVARMFFRANVVRGNASLPFLPHGFCSHCNQIQWHSQGSDTHTL